MGESRASSSKKHKTTKRPILSPDEEDELLKTFFEKARRGEEVLRQDVIDFVVKIIKSDNRKNPFRNGIPGDKWFSLIRRRHNPQFLALDPKAISILEKVGFTEKVKNTVFYHTNKVPKWTSKENIVLGKRTRKPRKSSLTSTPTSPLVGSVKSREEEDNDSDNEHPDNCAIREVQSNSLSDFSVGSRLDVMNFNGEWFPGTIIEEDYESEEILVHYEDWCCRYDEWVRVDSNRIRRPVLSKELPKDISSQLAKPLEKTQNTKPITKLKGKKIKENGRRSKKKTSELYCYQPRAISEKDPDRWNVELPPEAKPVKLTDQQGHTRLSIVIPDRNLPAGWTKHTMRRRNDTKWDVFLVNSEGRKFRSRTELRNYFSDLKLPFPESRFDFQVGRKMEVMRTDVYMENKQSSESTPKKKSSVLNRKRRNRSSNSQSGSTTDSADEKTKVKSPKRRLTGHEIKTQAASPPFPLTEIWTPDNSFPSCGESLYKENVCHEPEKDPLSDDITLEKETIKKEVPEENCGEPTNSEKDSVSFGVLYNQPTVTGALGENFTEGWKCEPSMDDIVVTEVEIVEMYEEPESKSLLDSCMVTSHEEEIQT